MSHTARSTGRNGEVTLVDDNAGEFLLTDLTTTVFKKALSTRSFG
jgi:hypothetical protein